MQHSFGVEEGNPIEYLLQYDFYLLLIYLVLFVCYEFLEIIVIVIEDDLQQLFFGLVLHVYQRYNVRMLLECFEDGDLSEGAGRDALFFAFKFDVFDCDVFVIFVNCFENFAEGSLAYRTNLLKLLMFFHFLNIIQCLNYKQIGKLLLNTNFHHFCPNLSHLKLASRYHINGGDNIF